MSKFALLLKHLWLDEADTRRAIPPDMVQRLAERVAASEQRHTGQIRICVESSLPASYLWRLDRDTTLGELIRQRALTMFGKLRVWDTEHNNGVLIYVLLAEHAIEIIADRGLMHPVEATHWQSVVANMSGAFQENRYEDGLTQALEETSGVLVAHFPRIDASSPYPNELPDTPLLQ
ncbi:putative membrane protein [Polaromonas sp. CG_9.5]|uniref:TPM domain-containing protein n=1 Tax=Polaromonas sp. CG_9.5 TaxID=3071705 RepID=UPI002E0B0E4B|nr:putative membrane protein [Polaromonas sp. CG_9.5]